MSQKILILGAAGQISRKLTAALLQQTDAQLVLYGRELNSRLGQVAGERVAVMEGNFHDADRLAEALQGVDVVYLNAMERPADTQSVVDAMQQAGVRRFIGASMAGIENEVPQGLRDWTKANLPASYIDGEMKSAAIVKASALDYTLLRLTWLYDDPSQSQNYELVPSGEPFADAEVSREAVVQAIIRVVTDAEPGKYVRTTFGVGQPGTHFDKPSFY